MCMHVCVSLHHIHTAQQLSPLSVFLLLLLSPHPSHTYTHMNARPASRPTTSTVHAQQSACFVCARRPLCSI